METRESILKLLQEVEIQLENENNLIQLETGTVIFAGDTHGDLEATKKVISNYLKSSNTVVFLGDYVDRRKDSVENLNALLKLKLENPDRLFLLMGNHEGYNSIKFQPADFWAGLDSELYTRYSQVLSRLPLVVTTSNGIIALHGALPDVKKISDVNSIEVGSDLWQQITWGDWQETEGRDLGHDVFSGRPQFGKDWFEEIMSRLNKNVLVRSHQPEASQMMFNNKCLTLFTSSSYGSKNYERNVAFVDLNKDVNSVDDLEIRNI